MAGKAEAAMRFRGGQFLSARAQMHGAIPIRGADDRRHARACRMGEAKRRREHGLHQEQSRDQAREEGGGVLHRRVLNPLGGGCQGFESSLSSARIRFLLLGPRFWFLSMITIPVILAQRGFDAGGRAICGGDGRLVLTMPSTPIRIGCYARCPTFLGSRMTGLRLSPTQIGKVNQSDHPSE